MTLEDEDRELIRACIVERYKLVSKANHLKSELAQTLNEIKQLSNRSLAKKFEQTMGVIKYQEKCIQHEEANE